MLYVPDINTNLLSMAKMTDYRYNVKFDKYGAIIYKDRGEVKMRVKRKGNAYYIRLSIINNEVAAI